MAGASRFGHRTVLVSQIDTSEVKETKKVPTNVINSVKINGFWLPILVEVIEENKRYVLVDGYKRFVAASDQLHWKRVECVVTAASSPSERAKKRLGIHSFNTTLSPYECHQVIHFLCNANQTAESIARFFNRQPSTIRSYMRATMNHKLDKVMMGQEMGIPYHAWIKVLDVPDHLLPNNQRELLTEALQTKRCHEYQLNEIIHCLELPRFSAMSPEQQMETLNRFIDVSTNRHRALFQLTVSEEVRIEPPTLEKSKRLFQHFVPFLDDVMDESAFNLFEAEEANALYKSLESLYGKMGSALFEETGYR